MLQDDDDNSSSTNSSESEQSTPSAHKKKSSTSEDVVVPSFEDLSLCRSDEETVLQAVYGSDFTHKESRQTGRTTRLSVHVRPPDTDANHVGTQLVLSLKLHKDYPYAIPTIQLQKVQGLSAQEQAELQEQLTTRGQQLAQVGSVMMVEMVQVTEDYLLEHNRDPTMSAWEEMKAREEKELETKRLLEQQQQAEINRLYPSKQNRNSSNNNSITSGLNNLSPSPMSMSSQAQNVFLLEQPFSDHSKSHHTHGSDHDGGDVVSSDIKKELNRQLEALEDARRIKQQSHGLLVESKDKPIDKTNNHHQLGGDFDDDDYSDEGSENDDDPMNYMYPDSLAAGSSTRYRTDFVELGVLGRGGGGEVVKVRNRLDRRIYAVKKIILESERGKFAKTGAIQNKKLRREVTTISRMTHKNIVRYYQAWVVGLVY